MTKPTQEWRSPFLSPKGWLFLLISVCMFVGLFMPALLPYKNVLMMSIASFSIRKNDEKVY